MDVVDETISLCHRSNMFDSGEASLRSSRGVLSVSVYSVGNLKQETRTAYKKCMHHHTNIGSVSKIYAKTPSDRHCNPLKIELLCLSHEFAKRHSVPLCFCFIIPSRAPNSFNQSEESTLGLSSQIGMTPRESPRTKNPWNQNPTTLCSIYK